MGRKSEKDSLNKYDVGAAIIAFLVDRKERSLPPASGHYITKYAPEFIMSTQRQQRIVTALKGFEIKGLVTSEKLESGTYWKITENGISEYKNTIKKAIDLFN